MNHAMLYTLARGERESFSFQNFLRISYKDDFVKGVGIWENINKELMIRLKVPNILFKSPENSKIIKNMPGFIGTIGSAKRHRVA